MPAPKSDYEKALGIKLTDDQYAKLTAPPGGGAQDRPVVEASLYKPSGANAPAPDYAMKHEAAKAGAKPIKSGVGGLSWSGEAPKTSVNGQQYGKPTGGGGYEYGTANVPNSAKYTDAFVTMPSNSSGAPSKTYNETATGQGINPAMAGEKPKHLADQMKGGAVPNTTYIPSVKQAPAGTFKPGAPVMTGTPGPVPTQIGPLPNVPITPPAYAAGATNTPVKVSPTAQVVDLAGDASNALVDGSSDLYDAIIGDERKKWGL